MARRVQTGTGMLRPTAFIRTMVDSATTRPFWTALLDMKHDRMYFARLAAQQPTVAPAPVEVFPQQAPSRAA